uniref:Heat shock factor-binding protein 1 n=1 Tax=Gasterosteus aculeatus aculeatus TaxID=481459 RepID=A0AAQ4R8A5_GASAC
CGCCFPHTRGIRCYSSLTAALVKSFLCQTKLVHLLTSVHAFDWGFHSHASCLWCVSQVQTLLQQMQDKFQTMSDQIIGRIDEMSTRIDDLEKNIADLMTQAGVEEIEAAPEKAKEGPGS